MSDLAAMYEAIKPTDPDGAMTIHEIRAALGCGDGKARQVIRELIEAGKMEPVRVRRKAITGIVMLTYGYRPV